MCYFFSLIKNDPKKTHINIFLGPTQTRDNSANLFMFMRLFFCWFLAEDKSARKRGRTLRKGVFLPSKHLLSAFYDTPPSKNPSKNLGPY